jgi:hypothetical protein
MDAETIIVALRNELQRHDFDTYVDNPPSIAQGGRGVVVSGCPACKKQMQSVNQFMHHLLDEVLPATVRKAFEDESVPS